MVIRRESGVLKRIRATPLRPRLPRRRARLDVHRLPDRGGADRRHRAAALSMSGSRRARARSSSCSLLGAAASPRWPRPDRLRTLGRGSSAVVNFVYLPMAIISGTFFTPRSTRRSCARSRTSPFDVLHAVVRDVMVRDHHLWSDAGSVAVVLPGARSVSSPLAAFAGSRASARARARPRRACGAACRRATASRCAREADPADRRRGARCAMSSRSRLRRPAQVEAST